MTSGIHKIVHTYALGINLKLAKFRFAIVAQSGAIPEKQKGGKKTPPPPPGGLTTPPPSSARFKKEILSYKRNLSSRLFLQHETVLIVVYIRHMPQA